MCKINPKYINHINKTNNAYDINYFITDHLGSTRVIVDNAGNIKAQYNYYPFGKQWEDINLMANTNRYTFSGKEKQTIKDLGWLDFTARMLSNSEIPMFTTQDPLAEKHYSWSPYVYVYNNPLRFIDPFGLDSLDAVALTRAAENAVKYVTDNYGTVDANCNRGVNHAFEELTGNNELAGKNANNMVKQLENSDNFETISQSEVQIAANDGEIVIAGKQASSGSGHVALAVPGKEESSTSWGGSAPVGMDTGLNKRWSKNGMNHSWGSNSGVKFYKYTGEKNGTTDNKTYYGGIISASTATAQGKSLLTQPMKVFVKF
jgi:RHS repeat-associated protein